MINADDVKESHIELSKLLRYPPFSFETDTDEDSPRMSLGEVAGKDIQAFHESIMPAIRKAQDELPEGEWNWEIEVEGDEAFAEFKEKWKDELEEARLYQSRYGDDFDAAAKAASGDE